MPFAWYVREKIYSIVLSIHIEYNLELINTYYFPICVVLGRKIFNATHPHKFGCINSCIPDFTSVTR